MKETDKDNVRPFEFYNHPVMGDGFILDWLVLGMLTAPVEEEYDDIPPEQKDDLLSVGGERRVSPYAGMKVRWQDRELTWRSRHLISPDSGFFGSQFFKEFFPKWGYVATYLESPDEREAFFWKGESLLWLNHKSLFADGEIAEAGGVYRVKLRKGLNFILAKIWCFRAGCQPALSFRVTDEKEKALKGVKIKFSDSGIQPEITLKKGFKKERRKKGERSLNVSFSEAHLALESLADDEFWEKSSCITDFIDRESCLAGQQTKVQALYDKRCIYFRVVLQEEHMESLKGEASLEGESAWRKDHFNIFLDPAHDHKNYYHFVINEAGEIFDRKRFNFLWNSKNTECLIRRNESSWTIYLAIPFADFGIDMPQDGEVWGVNFSRSEAPSGEGETFWLDTRNVTEFGELVFGKSLLKVISLSLGEPENRCNLFKAEIENRGEEKKVKYRIRVSSQKEEIFSQESKKQLGANSKKTIQIPYVVYYPGHYQLEFSLWEEDETRRLYRAIYPFKEGTSLLLKHTDFKGGLLNEIPLDDAARGECKVIYSSETGHDKLEAGFTLEREASCDKALLLECLGEKALVRLFINDKAVWEETLMQGAPPDPRTGEKAGFVRRTIVVKESLLRKGQNSILIQNCEKEGPVGVAPLFALKSLRIIVAEEEAPESKDDSRVITIGAERFDGEKSLLPVGGERAVYSLSTLKQTVTIPEKGEIKAPFVLEREPADNDREKSYYLLYLAPLKLDLPWVKASPDADPGVELSHYIQINGNNINNFSREEGYVEKTIMSFKITIPASYLHKGVNELSFKRTGLSSLAPREDRQFDDFTLVEKRIRDPHLLSAPRCVRAGDEFYLKLELLRAHRIEGIEAPGGIAFSGNLPLELGKGIHKLFFKALKPTGKSCIIIITNQGRYDYIVPRVIDIPDEGIKHAIVTMVSNDPDIYENHVKEIESIKDLDLGNTSFQRAYFSSGIQPEFTRKVAELYRKNRIYMSYSWGAVYKSGADRWNPPKEHKPLVSENDLKRWAGEYFLYGGSARIEPEARMYKDLLELKDAYIERMKVYYKHNPTYACHICEIWHRYAMEAGTVFPWAQINYSNSEVILSSMRGVSRAYGDTGFGVSGCDDCALAYTADERYMRMSAIHNWVSYLSGVTSFIPEISYWWAHNGRFLPFHRYFDDYFERQADRGRMLIEKDFYDYTRTHTRGKGPITPLAFIQGHLDAWDGRDGWDGKHDFYEGHYRPGADLWFRWKAEIYQGKVPRWPLGPAEAGWRHMREVFSHLKFIWRLPLIHPTDRKFYLCGTPYGKADITPIETSLESLKRYRALVFPGWNTSDENQYKKLTGYVEQGGVLFMSLPQLSTHIEREAGLKPVKDGNLEELFGVKVLGKGKEIKAIKFVEDSNQDGISFPVGKVYPLAGHERNTIHLASLDNLSARVLAEADGKPALLEKKSGRGYAYLLCLWNYPGEEKLTSFLEDIVSSIARGVQSSVRVTGNDNVNFGVFLDEEGSAKEGEVVTRIFLSDIDWWSVEKKESHARLHLKDKAFPLTLPRADIKKVVWFRKIAISSRDKMVHIETIGETDSGYRIPLQGVGKCSFDLFILEGKISRIMLNDKEVEYKEDKENSMVSFQIQLSGRDILTVKL